MSCMLMLFPAVALLSKIISKQSPKINNSFVVSVIVVIV